MDETKKSSEPDLLEDKGLFIARWPLATPPMHSKADIISVAVGNSSIIWACHSSYERSYNPYVVWRTPAPTGEVTDDIGDRTKLHLSNVIPQKVLKELFGSFEFTVSSASQYRYARKRIPLIYVYVISTNPSNAALVVSLLEGIPCIVYRVSAEDFLISPPSSLTGTFTEPNGGTDETAVTQTSVQMYSGIGVDRVASMAGASLLYPDASHVLIVDGGTALTYTTMVEKEPISEGAPIFQFGGGICPGLQLRMRALYDFSDDLPLVDHTLVSEIVNDCMEKKQPLPLFTSAQSLEGEPDQADGVVNSEQAVVKSILGCVMTEIALLLCCVIRKWLSNPTRKVPTDKNTLPVVIVTGGDGEYYEKLLRHHHSYICETNAANIDLLNHGISDDDANDSPTDDAAVITRDHFLLKQKKYLQHFGIRSLLIQNTVYVTTKNENEETLRNQLLGLRVVLRKNAAKQFGTIFAVKRAVDFENDRYLVCGDTDGKIVSLGIMGVFDALSRYSKSQEKAKSRDENIRIGYENKQKDALEAMDELRKKSKAVRLAVESRKDQSEAPKAPQPSLTNVVGSIGQKRKHTDGNKTQPKKKVATDPKVKYIDRRVAKHFSVDEDGTPVMKLFFGTVTEFLKEHSWWHVEYDDGDNEDMSTEELLPCLKLHAENKAEDPKA